MQALRSGAQFSLHHGHVWSFSDGTLPEKGCACCVPQVQDAAWTGGIRFLFEEIWDCGTARTIPFLERNRTLDCAGPVRCFS